MFPWGVSFVRCPMAGTSLVKGGGKEPQHLTGRGPAVKCVSAVHLCLTLNLTGLDTFRCVMIISESLECFSDLSFLGGWFSFYNLLLKIKLWGSRDASRALLPSLLMHLPPKVVSYCLCVLARQPGRFPL